MRQHEDRNWTTREMMLAVVTMACAMSAAERSDGQYYYQPPPSYYQNDTVGGTFAGGTMARFPGAHRRRSHRGEGASIGAGVGAITGTYSARSRIGGRPTRGPAARRSWRG